MRLWNLRDWKNVPNPFQKKSELCQQTCLLCLWDKKRSEINPTQKTSFVCHWSTSTTQKRLFCWTGNILSRIPFFHGHQYNNNTKSGRKGRTRDKILARLPNWSFFSQGYTSKESRKWCLFIEITWRCKN